VQVIREPTGINLPAGARRASAVKLAAFSGIRRRLPTNPLCKLYMQTAKILGVRLREAPTRRIEDYDDATATMTGENVNSLLVMASPINYSNNASRLIQLTLKHRLPALFGYKQNVQAGGLMSYAADVLDLYRRSAVYIDKILKGTKPADLPVESSLRCARWNAQCPVFRMLCYRRRPGMS
jgi:hypothetical protein